MKRFGVALFLVLLWASLSALAQYTSDQTSSTQSSSQTASSSKGKTGKLEHLKGKISDDGKTFTSDKDKASWTISNPDAVKGHEGHDVSLSAHVYPDKNEIHVMSVKMASEKSSTKDKHPMSEKPPQ